MAGGGKVKLSMNQDKDEDLAKIFTDIYQNGVWGRSADISQKFYSGGGSHNPQIVNEYVNSVAVVLGFFQLFLDRKPDIVDLGCGDFAVGARLRGLARNYAACDIVEPLIAFNRERFKDLAVDFSTIDLSKDPLPAGDVVFIRQVLQHLSNAQIIELIPKLSERYRYLVLTEHLPSEPGFIHNLDKPSGPDIRLRLKSGVVLTSPPFNLSVSSDFRLCEITDSGGVIRTNLYKIGRPA